MRKKKNRFLLFCFSFLPGAGELYLGFMNMGLSLILTFSLLWVVVGVTSIGILSFLPMVLWVYSFFHANNLGALSDEEFYRIEDTYLFGLDHKEMESLKKSLSGRYRKVAAIILILLGISMLWDVTTDYIYDMVGPDFYYAYVARYVNAISSDLPQLIISIVIIWCGVKLIRGKKIELDNIEESTEKNAHNGMYQNVSPNMNQTGNPNMNQDMNHDSQQGGGQQ
ncbi:MAG: hypothetical protein J1D87_00190 [Lachnospiraceae bacterium]|nr:hypothetical protein [Lachnospiraceae bacterium]